MGKEYKWGVPVLEIGGKPIRTIRNVDYMVIDDLDSPGGMIRPAHAHWDKRDSQVTEALESLVKIVRENEQGFRLAWGVMDNLTTMIRRFQLRFPPLRFRSNVPRKLSRSRRKQRLTRLQRRNKRQKK